MTIVAINPATEQVCGRYEELSPPEVEAAVSSAAEAARGYRDTTPAARARWLKTAAGILEERKTELGRLMTTEMGKPIGAAIAEAEKCAWVCRYYAENGSAQLADDPVPTDGRDSFIRYEPLGIVLAIMPWNFPFWQVFRFAAPALMAGNVGLLKHASNVPGCALEIERILASAGLPVGCFQTLLIGAGRAQELIRDRRIRAVTLTGSDVAGRAVARTAGEHIKKTVLELGGSDPFIVMPSADIDAAVGTAVQARTINNGQSCIAAKRFIIHQSVADDFERGFVAGMRALRVGDPLRADTDVGPLATEAIRQELHRQVTDTVAAGATVLLGGKPIAGPGFFYEPTVLTDIPAGSAAYREELFGPVAALFRVDSADQALHLANDSAFGLGAAVWTHAGAEADLFVNRLETGCVFVNGMVASDPRLPFGGVKDSGYGRELGVFGIREFVNIKAVSRSR